MKMRMNSRVKLKGRGFEVGYIRFITHFNTHHH